MGSACNGQGFQFAPDTGEQLARLASSITVHRLDECLSVREGSLHIEGCGADELARRFGTPLYVISEDQLRRNVRRFQDAFAPRCLALFALLPSIKANSVLALRRILSDEGTGCDVFGGGELEAALQTGRTLAESRSTAR